MTLRDLFCSRLGLERAKTAREALDVITGLLSTHGQGGNTCEDHNFGQWTYHNSYIIVDPQEAWLLDTAGKLWAAKKVTCKDYEISNILRIFNFLTFFSANSLCSSSKFDSSVISRISEYKKLFDNLSLTSELNFA